MEKEKILQLSTRRYGGDDSTLELLGGFYNNVFSFEQGQQERVLKLMPMDRHQLPEIKGELEWVNYLADNGIRVTKPILSEKGNYIEEIDFQDCGYYIVVFEKAQGRLVDVENEEEWNGQLFKKWGQLMGQMHSLAKDYTPSDQVKIRDWKETDLLSEINQPIHQGILEKWNHYRERLNYLRELSTDRDSYGVIHNDLHHQNFYLDGEQLVIFDFGDLEYNWFIYDIAISLYHALELIPYNQTRDRIRFTDKFITNFMAGYLQENSLEDRWLFNLKDFLEYRQLWSYLYFKANLDQENMSPAHKKYLKAMKERIVNNGV